MFFAEFGIMMGLTGTTFIRMIATIIHYLYNLLKQIKFQAQYNYRYNWNYYLWDNVCQTFELISVKYQMKYCLIYTFIIIILCNEAILELPLLLSKDNHIQTTFTLGDNQVRVNIDINNELLDICCKNKDTLFKKIYYFMINPFRQNEDYYCKNSKNDTAKFQKIGPISINFNEIIYPNCDVGTLGLNINSTFLALMPTNERYYVISKQSSQQNVDTVWKLSLGDPRKNSYNYLQVFGNNQWTAQVPNLEFNLIQLGPQQLKFDSSRLQIVIPSEPFKLVLHELITGFQCEFLNSQIVCPCTAGISPSFPKFVIKLKGNDSIRILETGYLKEDDEICKAIIVQGEQSYWEINILLLDKIDVLFDYGQHRIGFATHLDSIQSNEAINQPLQIMLNCAVILLMCFFIAMVLIEVIKHFVGFEKASNQSFQSYMLKHSE